MPTISMFFGILVMLMYKDGERHHLPHIHVRYAGQKASIAIETGTILAGDIPAKQLNWYKPGLKFIRKSFLLIGS